MSDAPYQAANTPEIQLAYKSANEWREDGFQVIPGEKPEFYAVKDPENDPHVRIPLYHGNQIQRIHDHWNWPILDADSADNLRKPAAKTRKAKDAVAGVDDIPEDIPEDIRI